VNPRIALGLAGAAAFVGLAAAVTTFAPHAAAQGAAPAPYAEEGAGQGQQATVNDPPGAPPDSSRIIVTLPGQIKWKGNEALMYGDPTKPGDPYGVLVKLSPGDFSAPHTLSTDRWVFVISGTLWVTDKSDPKSSYPVKPSSFVTNLAKTTYSDGNRAGAAEPTVLFISGVGSADNHVMGEYSHKTTVSIKDTAGSAPDVSHITISDIPTTGNANIYGGGQDSDTEGSPYGVVQTWVPGRYSSPHYHPHPRYIYVIQGPWWVSSSSVKNTMLTYPVPTGSFVQDIPHGIHWDGNRLGEKTITRLYITGVSPATNHPVDEAGNDLPIPPRGAGRRGAPGAGAPAAAPGAGR